VTVSVPKKNFIVWGVAAILLLGICFIWTRPYNDPPPANTVELSNHKFKLEFATTQEEQEQGLSGREGLGEQSAMLFTFGEMGQRCFWMKDMKFSIDMIWIDNHNKIVAIEHDVSPSTYPASFCHDGQNVLEVVASTSKSINLQIGQAIRIY
jgi:uncharacterized protein